MGCSLPLASIISALCTFATFPQLFDESRRNKILGMEKGDCLFALEWCHHAVQVGRKPLQFSLSLALKGRRNTGKGSVKGREEGGGRWWKSLFTSLKKNCLY